MLAMALEADELDIFDVENYQQMLLFKWNRFAKPIHLLGCLMHFVYVTVLILYVFEIYINYEQQNARIYQTLLILGVVYPAMYESRQLMGTGFVDYFSEYQNYSDLLYIWGSVTNVIL